MTPANRRVRPPRLPLDLGGDAAEAGEAHARLVAGSGPPLSSSPRAGLTMLRTIAGVALVGATSVGLAWVARRELTGSARFAIASIDVVGGDHRPPAVLIAESGLVLGTNVFAADLDLARSKLLQDPWIADASLVRRLPAAVVVRVAERRPAALVVLDETYLATADGVPFKRLEPEDPIDLPVVTGITPERIEADRDGATRAIGRAIDLAAEFDRSAIGRHAPLQEVHVGDDGTFTLVVGHGGMQLVLGGPPFRRKLDQASRVLAELERRGGKADAVLLDNDTRPDRVVVRMR